MVGLWSNPSEFPRLPDEEEIGGEMNWLVLEGHLGMVLMKTLVCSDLEGHQVLDKSMKT